MPRIGTQLLKSVFYLFGHLQNQFINHNAPAGTGFFVGRHSTALPLTRHVYAVSNWHVVRDAPCVRVNLVGGGSRKLEIEHDEWVPLAGEDMAAADVTDHLRQSPDPLQGYDDISWLEEHSFVRQQGFRDAAVGDDTFMVGLFSDHRGDTENAPVGRFGNIASVPNAAMPVELHPKDPYPSPAYLNDMRSRTGFSGSPVWVWRAGHETEDISEAAERREGVLLTRAFMRFLGIHRGQMWEQTEIKECKARPELTGTKIAIASSMTVVIPAWQVTKLLDTDLLRSQRDQRDSRRDRIELAGEIRDSLRRKALPVTFHRRP